MKHNVKNACIFEDDVTLCDGVTPQQFNTVLSNSFGKVSNKFDIFYITMTPISIEDVDGFTKRVKKALAMPAFIINRSYYSKLLNIYKKALDTNKPHDLVTQLYQHIDRWYGIFPAIARQEPGYSDIEKREVDYTYLDVKGSMIY